MKRNLVRIAVLGCVVGALSAMSSCNIVAPIAYIIEGPPKIEAVYKIDSGRKTVIFIDDRSSKIPKRRLRQQIGESAEGDMLRKGVVKKGQLITARSAERAASGESNADLMSIVDIGRTVGAEVIIYIDMEQFTITTDGASLSPQAIATVKVFDTVTNERITTISGQAFHKMQATMPPDPTPLPSARSEREQAYEGLAAFTGVHISRLFYTHERDALSDFR